MRKYFILSVVFALVSLAENKTDFRDNLKMVGTELGFGANAASGPQTIFITPSTDKTGWLMIPSYLGSYSDYVKYARFSYSSTDRLVYFGEDLGLTDFRIYSSTYGGTPTQALVMNSAGQFRFFGEVVVHTLFRPATNNTVDLGSAVLAFQDGFFAGDVTVGSGADIRYGSDRSRLRSPQDGILTMVEADAVGFSALNFGGNSSAFVGLRSSSTTLDVRRGDGTIGATFLVNGSQVATAGDNLGFFSPTTSAQLAGIMIDETGSAGNLVFSGGPTFTGIPLPNGDNSLDFGSTLFSWKDIWADGDLYMGAGGALRAQGRGRFQFVSDGAAVLYNNALNGFSALSFGGTGATNVRMFIATNSVNIENADSSNTALLFLNDIPVISGSLSLTANNVPKTLSTAGSILQPSWLFLVQGTNSSVSYSSLTIDGPNARTDLNLFSEAGAVYFGPPADGTTTGGNNRGLRAVDLQMTRAAATRVASGSTSFAAGTENVASGLSSTAVNENNTASGSYTFSSGYINAATDQYAANLGGVQSTASAVASSTMGNNALANKYGQHAFSSGIFAAQGDMQGSRVVLRTSMAAAVTNVLFLDGSSARLTIPANTSWFVKGTAIMRTATATLSVNGYDIEAVVERGSAANTVNIPYQQILETHEDIAGDSLTLTDDDTNGAITFSYIAADSTGRRIGMVLYITEVTFP